MWDLPLNFNNNYLSNSSSQDLFSGYYWDWPQVGTTVPHTAQEAPNREYAGASQAEWTDRADGYLTDPANWGSSRHHHHYSLRQAFRSYPCSTSGSRCNTYLLELLLQGNLWEIASDSKTEISPQDDRVGSSGSLLFLLGREELSSSSRSRWGYHTDTHPHIFPVLLFMWQHGYWHSLTLFSNQLLDWSVVVSFEGKTERQNHLNK